jgi:hypothetical protein
MPSCIAASASLRVIVPTHSLVEFDTGIEAKYSSIFSSWGATMAKKLSSKGPRISLNKLAEYTRVRANRQRQILRDQKYPTEFKGPYYREAAEAIAKCIVSGLEDIAVVEKAIKLLEQQRPDKMNCPGIVGGRFV